MVAADLTWRRQLELSERWRLIVPNRPGFAGSPLERGDFEVEAPLFAELLGGGAHLVGHSYGGDRAARGRAATRGCPIAVRLGAGLAPVAAGVPVVDKMIADGELLFSNPDRIPPEVFLRYFRSGAGSARETPDELPEPLARGVELLDARASLVGGGHSTRGARGGAFPKLVISGDHSPAFEAVCDALGDAIGAERAVIPGRGHTIPSTGDPYNRALEAFMARAERERGTPITSTNPS